MEPRSRSIAVVLGGAIAVAGVVSAVLLPGAQFLALGIAFLSSLVAATALGPAGRIARSLRPLVKRRVRVEVWGRPLPDSGDASFEVVAISAAGVGLLIWLRSGGESRSLLKIAQPRSTTWDGDTFTVGSAKYVSWAGKKIRARPRTAASQALVLSPLRSA